MKVDEIRLYVTATLLPKASRLTKSPKGVEIDKGDNRPIPHTCKGVLKMVEIGQVITPQEIAIDLKEQIRIIRTRLFVLELLGRVRRIPGDRYIIA